MIKEYRGKEGQNVLKMSIFSGELEFSKKESNDWFENNREKVIMATLGFFY